MPKQGDIVLVLIRLRIYRRQSAAPRHRDLARRLPCRNSGYARRGDDVESYRDAVQFRFESGGACRGHAQEFQSSAR